MDLSGLSSDGELGFELVGGRDDPHYPNDSGVYVASVTKGSIADGKLRYILGFNEYHVYQMSI